MIEYVVLLRQIYTYSFLLNGKPILFGIVTLVTYCLKSLKRLLSSLNIGDIMKC